MAGKVIGTSFDKGFPGTISRSIDDVIEAFANKDTAALDFGVPVVMNSTGTGVVAFTNTSTAADLLGFTVRVAKTNETWGADDAKYAVGDMVDVMKRGTICVKVTTGSPAVGGKVYLRKATGAIVTAAETHTAESATVTDTVELTNVRFKSAKDSNNVAEVAVLYRNL